MLYCSPSCVASESSAADLYPYSSVKKTEPDIKVKKHKRKESRNELNMCLNLAVGMHSFSLGFPSRKPTWCQVTGTGNGLQMDQPQMFQLVFAH